ncbi:hypothetical protein [Mycobacteroides abscessus]|uniref:hypothetical protein n=1 Tax=Mycobacteroides abscessus TaxID=36809 RepID=UPI000926ACE7|nr:hypothetical protein [Mycobacteroides abscessus]SIH82768.1 Uncharacterised protein [Mycobacteroides abscessus subsp. abscessus]SLI39551.1 Uncharacterised protein [Mycobacteroides abscessus subsp. abscessus]
MRIDDAFAVELEPDEDDPEAPTVITDVVSVELLEGGAIHVVAPRPHKMDGHVLIDSTIYPAHRVKRIDVRVFTLVIYSNGRQSVEERSGVTADVVRGRISALLSADGVDRKRIDRFVDHLLAGSWHDHFPDADFMAGKHDYHFSVYR